MRIKAPLRALQSVAYYLLSANDCKVFQTGTPWSRLLVEMPQTALVTNNSETAGRLTSSAGSAVALMLNWAEAHKQSPFRRRTMYG